MWREHVQAASVRHPNHDLLGPVAGALTDRLVDERHQHVGALEGEALLAEIGAVKELLEALYLGESGQQPSLFVVRKFPRELFGLDGVPEPLRPRRILQMLELEAHGAAVDLLQMAEG